MMTDRARLSKRSSYKDSKTPGAEFLGSPDFPQALRDAVALYDPAGLMLPGHFNPTGPDSEIGKATLDRFKVLVRERLQGKKILNLSGKVDKLVPYKAGEPFLKVFKQVLEEERGTGLDVRFEDVLFDGVGHAFPRPMADKAMEWVCELLADEEGGGTVLSKI